MQPRNVSELDIEACEALLKVKSFRKRSKGKSRSKSKSKHRRKHQHHRSSKSPEKSKDTNQVQANISNKQQQSQQPKNPMPPIIEPPIESKEMTEEEKIKKEILDEEERKKKEIKLIAKQFEEAKKQAEEAKRDDLTVLILQIPVSATEKDVYQFFVTECGKIRDIRIIKDTKTGKSKGISYIEFYSQDSVLKAINMSGQIFKGNCIKVQPSQAEKNRTALAQRQLKAAKNPVEHQPSTSGPMRIYVGGLEDQLATMEEQDLRDLFSPYGEIEFVDLHRDAQTGQSKGYAFIQYKNVADAKAAINKMNGFKVKNKSLKVSSVQGNMMYNIQDYSNIDLDDESDSLSKLGLGIAGLGAKPPIQTNIPGNTDPSKPPIASTPTTCLLLSNMFSTDKKNEPSFFADLRDEVLDEAKKFGAVDKILVDQHSDGNVWLKYNSVQSAVEAQNTFNAKYFSGKKINCYFVPEGYYNSKIASS